MSLKPPTAGNPGVNGNTGGYAVGDLPRWDGSGWEPEGRDSEAVTLYASTTGDDDNDGLASTRPKTFQGALDELLNHGPVLSGTWTIQLAAGTYEGGFAFPKRLHSRNRVIIKGPDVGGHPNVPTAIIDATGEGNGLILDVNCQVQVQDIKVTNIDTANSSTAASFLAETGSDVYFKNCHSNGDAAYAGIFSKGLRCRVDGGILDGTHQYGFEFYGGVVWTTGYTAAALTDGPQVSGATSAGILCQHAYGDCFFTTVTGGTIACLVTSQGRVRFESCSFSSQTTANVKAQEVSAVDLFGNTNTLTQSGSGVPLILSGGSTELTLHGNLNATADERVAYDTGGHTLSGTTSLTIVTTPFSAIPTWLVGKKIRVRLAGTFAGAGTKSPGVRVLSTDYLSFTSSSASTSNWAMEVEIHLTTLSTQLVRGWFMEAGQSVQVGKASKSITLTGSQSLRVYGTNSDGSTGSMTVDTVEVFVG